MPEARPRPSIGKRPACSPEHDRQTGLPTPDHTAGNAKHPASVRSKTTHGTGRGASNDGQVMLKADLRGLELDPDLAFWVGGPKGSVVEPLCKAKT